MPISRSSIRSRRGAAPAGICASSNASDRAICSSFADQALTAARTATALPQRAALLVEADRRLAEVVPYIPLARPLRWSLVAQGVDAWRDNALAVHPLAHLRD